MDVLRSFWRTHVLRQPQHLYALHDDEEELVDLEGSGGKPGQPKAQAGKAVDAPGPAASLWTTHREEFLSLLPFLWPREEPKLKVFIVLAFVCLIAAKLFNILVRGRTRRSGANVGCSPGGRCAGSGADAVRPTRRCHWR